MVLELIHSKETKSGAHIGCLQLQNGDNSSVFELTVVTMLIWYGIPTKAHDPEAIAYAVTRRGLHTQRRKGFQSCKYRTAYHKMRGHQLPSIPAAQISTFDLLCKFRFNNVNLSTNSPFDISRRIDREGGRRITHRRIRIVDAGSAASPAATNDSSPATGLLLQQLTQRPQFIWAELGSIYGSQWKGISRFLTLVDVEELYNLLPALTCRTWPTSSLKNNPNEPTDISEIGKYTIRDEHDGVASTARIHHSRMKPSIIIRSASDIALRSDGNYGEGGGYTVGWDSCSNTSYLFNVGHQTVVSYDGKLFDAVHSDLLIILPDTWSLNDKAKWSRENELAGCFSWSLDQDEGYNLQNVVRKALGK
ncbi:hypothetical protein BKA70DRAFT_1559595 [Coprinopsis sp. MPI-PUGE-AT-0042]|nr:hypothetical protein BKA70DRAFT_1559595 [Coprinopsis sp. MPI-PUGE-AT-0042]